jgi:hypothetical protein
MADVPAEVVQSPERRVGERRRSRFWGKDFTVEDLILYAFGAVLLTMFWIMFTDVQLREEKIAATRATSALAGWAPTNSEDLRLAHMKAQLSLSSMRYEQALRTSAGISARRNFGFLIGAILTLLGSVIAVRGARGSSAVDAQLEAKDYAKVKITTTSSGAFIVLLGTVIVLATVLNNDHVRVEDHGIALAGIAAEQPPATDTTATGTVTDDIVQALQETKPIQKTDTE